MWERMRAIVTTPDLRNKILLTLGILFLANLLSNIPVPLTHDQRLKLAQLFSGSLDTSLGQIFGLLDAFTGGSMQQFSIVALGVYPYITATIVMNLLTPIIPGLQGLMQNGEAGRQQFNQITRLITLPLAFLQGWGQAAILVRANVLDVNSINLFGPKWLYALTILITWTAGTMMLVWLGELITERGLGNGISLIIFAGIVSTLPSSFKSWAVTSAVNGEGAASVLRIVVFLLISLAVIFGMVYLYQAQRRVPISYPTKRQMEGGIPGGSSQKTYIPLQVNSAGMIPLIFANSMLIFPGTLSQLLVTNSLSWLSVPAQWIVTYLTNPRQWCYWAFYFVLIVAFTYFYTHVQWQQQRIVENLQKQGAFVPGYRPGEPTNRHLIGMLNRITLAGALALGLIAVLPFMTGYDQMLNTTKLLIVVGVVLDTVRQANAQMVMRNYGGFLS